MTQANVRAARNAPLAVSGGDPAGIGPDIILKAWSARRTHDLPVFYCHADPAQLAERARLLDLDIAIASVTPGEAAAHFPEALPVVALSKPFSGTLGVPSVANADGIVEAIDNCVADCFSGTAAAMVTAPISKKPLYESGFRFPGHTEYLAELSARHKGGDAPRPVMMIAGPLLKTIPVTIHIPLADVPSALRMDDIMETVIIADNDLRSRFGIENPRVAVAGLNPHAGEGGTIGTEDETIVRPAIEALQKRGIDVTGPLPADTMFHAAARETYDVAVCMYHDQALIPAKALGFDDGVNVTLGLPFIRTSPDHGTAFSLAGTGAARPDSFIAALKMAAQMAGHAHG